MVRTWVVRLVVGVVVGLAVVGLGLVAVDAAIRSTLDTETLPPRHGQVDAVLFVGDVEPGFRVPLVVGLGGSEGGNAWASDHWQAERDRLLARGYAMLAVGYFGTETTPEALDRIELQGVYDAIAEAARDPRIDGRCVAVLGGSKGGELALALGSHDPTIDAVVGLSAGTVVFPSITLAMTTSSWTYAGVALPFTPVPLSATPALITGDLRGAFEAMLADPNAVKAARIPIERTGGPILLLTGHDDELWPAREMADTAMVGLAEAGFPHAHQHVSFGGGHEAPLAELDTAFLFLDAHFHPDRGGACRD